jgi:hypothetical protein
MSLLSLSSSKLVVLAFAIRIQRLHVRELHQVVRGVSQSESEIYEVWRSTTDQK